MWSHHAKQKIGLIWAEGANREIGRNGTLPWHLPEDLAHFKELTEDSAIIMGKRTWASLPPQARPLPGRFNIVLSRTETSETFPGAEVVPSLEAALALTEKHQNVWVIGGESVFKEALQYANVIEVTEVDMLVPDADTFAPEIPDEFGRKDCTWWQYSKKDLKLGYRFVSYERGWVEPEE